MCSSVLFRKLANAHHGITHKYQKLGDMQAASAKTRDQRALSNRYSTPVVALQATEPFMFFFSRVGKSIWVCEV